MLRPGFVFYLVFQRLQLGKGAVRVHFFLGPAVLLFAAMRAALFPRMFAATFMGFAMSPIAAIPGPHAILAARAVVAVAFVARLAAPASTMPTGPPCRPPNHHNLRLRWRPLFSRLTAWRLMRRRSSIIVTNFNRSNFDRTDFDCIDFNRSGFTTIST